MCTRARGRGGARLLGDHHDAARRRPVHARRHIQDHLAASAQHLHTLTALPRGVTILLPNAFDTFTRRFDNTCCSGGRPRTASLLALDPLPLHAFGSER